jgi:hypothetical protein
MAHTIPFHELQARVALHIWRHSIKISHDQSDPYDIPNDTLFYNSQKLSKNSKEDNNTSLFAMENHLFDHLFDAIKDQSQAMYAFMDHISSYSNGPFIQEIPNSDKISSTPPHSNEPTVQESPEGDEMSITLPYLNKLPIQETSDGDEIATCPITDG